MLASKFIILSSYFCLFNIQLLSHFFTLFFNINQKSFQVTAPFSHQYSIRYVAYISCEAGYSNTFSKTATRVSTNLNLSLSHLIPVLFSATPHWAGYCSLLMSYLLLNKTIASSNKSHSFQLNNQFKNIILSLCYLTWIFQKHCPKTVAQLKLCKKANLFSLLVQAAAIQFSVICHSCNRALTYITSGKHRGLLWKEKCE